MGMEVSDSDFRQIMGLLDRDNKGEIDYVRGGIRCAGALSVLVVACISNVTLWVAELLACRRSFVPRCTVASPMQTIFQVWAPCVGAMPR